jgi:hypothetical protein
MKTNEHLELVRKAAERRHESERHFRHMIVAARANGLPLSPIADAANLSVGRIHAILEEEKMQTYASAPSTLDAAATDDVLVVAARIAYDEYLNYNAYVCQDGRSFRDVNRLGFYRQGQIERHFPSIRAIEDHVPFSADHVETLRTSGSPIDHEIADLIETLVGHHRRDDWDTYQVFLLTPPDDLRTLTLANPITHNTTGRGSAWTMGQRYIAETALLCTPATTDEL